MLDLGGSQPAQDRGAGTPLASTEEPSRLGTILAGLLVLIVAAVTLVVFFVDRAQQQKITRLQAEYTQQQSELTVGRYAQITREVLAADAAGKALVAAASRPDTWSLLLKNFQETTTQGIRLQSISVNNKSELKIDGEAPTFGELSQYLATVQGSSFIESVSLLSAGTTQAEDQLVVQFSIGMTLAPVTSAGGAR